MSPTALIDLSVRMSHDMQGIVPPPKFKKKNVSALHAFSFDPFIFGQSHHTFNCASLVMRHGRVHLDESSKCATSNTWTWTKLNWKLKSQNPQKPWAVEKTWFPSSHHESLFTPLLCICSSCHEELFYRCLDDIHRRNGTQNFKHLQRPRQTEVSYKSAVAWCKVFMILLHIFLYKELNPHRPSQQHEAWSNQKLYCIKKLKDYVLVLVKHILF